MKNSHVLFQVYLIGTNLSQSGDIDYREAMVIPDQGSWGSLKSMFR